MGGGGGELVGRRVAGRVAAGPPAAEDEAREGDEDGAAAQARIPCSGLLGQASRRGGEGNRSAGRRRDCPGGARRGGRGSRCSRSSRGR